MPSNVSAGKAETGSDAAPQQRNGEDKEMEEDPALAPLYAGGDLAKQRAKIDSAALKEPLLPAFLRVRGLVRQHIVSFNHFVSTGLRQIVLTPANAVVTCDADPSFYLR
jgi:DNA-directed RNA polymerase III subunit RPC2